MSDSIFTQIINGDIPGDFVYKDDLCVAINDIAPQAPVHILVIPRKPIKMISDAGSEDQALLGHLLLVAAKLAKENGIEEHFRLLINNGEGAGQTVFHLHVHLLGNDSFAEQGLAEGL